MAGWDQKLCTAAKEGKINEVELSVRNGANLECRDELGGSTPLMLAAGGGHLEVLMYLVSHGSQLEATDTMDEKTALHYAARNGWIDVTKWLIDQKCSPWVKTKQGQTPFDMVTIESYDSDVEKRKKKEVMNFLKVNILS
ncbi:fibronectin type 3 and ankyrin repeat domains 1 protein-like isoform X2 [Mytilus edulis]|uniref:fibronectin type 3 and ankyrin repeat domains 1 protein-like isoform X2 n=1 Tax=Mytilus edulis TaxID=6550 RepID=UPI0039EFB8D0